MIGHLTGAYIYIQRPCIPISKNDAALDGTQLWNIPHIGIAGRTIVVMPAMQLIFKALQESGVYEVCPNETLAEESPNLVIPSTIHLLIKLTPFRFWSLINLCNKCCPGILPGTLKIGPCNLC